MRKSSRGSPRSEPERIYNDFCQLMRRQPGDLNIDTMSGFNGLVGQFFIVPKRNEFWAKLRPSMRAWHAEIEKQRLKGSYVKRKRRSITDGLWELLAQLYWNYAAWIILRGEYKAMKKTLLCPQIEKRLKEQYGYLPQVKRDGWFEEVKKGSPLDLAYRDTAESLGLDEGSLRVMLSPKRLRESPPSSLISVSMDSKKLLSRLLRIPPFRRTAKDRELIRFIKSEFISPL